MKNKSILITILLFFLTSLIINLSNSYKLERYIEEKDWEIIENEKENVFKPVIVERRELLFFRFQRSGNTENSSSTESVSVKFEIHSKDIQETFYLFGLNNETSIRNIKDVELKDRKEETTPIRKEACFDPIKPLYFSLSMFNYLWGGDLLFTIQENNLSYCINSMPIKKNETISLISTGTPTPTPTPTPTTTPTPTPTTTPTPTPSKSLNDTVTANVTSSPSITPSASITPSPSPSTTPSVSVTPSPSPPAVVSNKQKIESDYIESEIPIDTTKKSLVETSPVVENKQMESNSNNK
ncbi:hypothetical protein ACTFIY_001164 [Dictyostelium cf. discoideum]